MDQEYPQVYRNDEGVELIALNEIQGDAFERNGFKPTGEQTEGRKKRGQ